MEKWSSLLIKGNSHGYAVNDPANHLSKSCPRFIIQIKRYSLDIFREISITGFMKQIVLLVLAIYGCWSESHAQKKQLVFATYTYSTNTRLQNLVPLTTLLSKKTGLAIKAVSYPTVQALISAIRNDSVDFAMMNTSGYLVLQRNHPGIVLPMVNLDMGTSISTNYSGCVIAGKQSGILSLKNLSPPEKKIPLALVNSSSTSGNLVPRLILNNNSVPDPETSFQVAYSGTHRKVVEDVLDGTASIGGCGCPEVDSARKYLDFDSRAIVIDSLNNIPLGPIIYNKKLTVSIIRSISNHLMQLHREDPGVFNNFCGGWTEFKTATRFKKVSDNDYDQFRNLFGNSTELWKLIE
ncbi:MAG: hypothetical protein EOO04_13840 [Chitinophagaceae bacterium]|nr:MAG: hypothetical protein EOO04_13840 [Chitinophagaceae bacterium]